MSMTRTRIWTVALAVGGTAGVASAAFDNTMYSIGSDPGSWGFASPVASLNAQGAGYSFQSNSGFAFELLGMELDRTDVQSDVYVVNAPQVFNQGLNSITLNPGDLVFAYRVTLVQAVPGSTVSSLGEAQVIGAPLFGFGQDPMDFSLVKGMGFVTPGHVHVPVSGNYDDAAEFGSSLDWEWPGSDAGNLDNDESIVMLMFTNPANLGLGVLNLTAPPGQTGGITGSTNDQTNGTDYSPPVYIPIVPSPGAALIGFMGSSFLVVGRRRPR